MPRKRAVGRASDGGPCQPIRPGTPLHKLVEMVARRMAAPEGIGRGRGASSPAGPGPADGAGHPADEADAADPDPARRYGRGRR